VTACSKCHGDQAAWWNSDPHAGAASRLSSRRALQIAHYYGLSSAEMRSSKALCMDCHAGRGARALEDGVTCEACHGPGKDYEKPHQDIKALGPSSSPYKRALSLGMVDLRRADPMSKACAQCHYITQDRLISSGHSTGANFALGQAHSKINHWKGTGVAAATLDAAYAKTRTERGEIPTVRVVDLSLGGSDGDTQTADH
jgi:hypothetical protein